MPKCIVICTYTNSYGWCKHLLLHILQRTALNCDFDIAKKVMKKLCA